MLAPVLLGLPPHKPYLPQFPYLPVDELATRTSGVLPQERNAQGWSKPACSCRRYYPGPVSALGPQPAPGLQPAPGPQPAAAQPAAAPVSAAVPVPAYTFPFWPAIPWDVEPPNVARKRRRLKCTKILGSWRLWVRWIVVPRW